MDSNIKLNYTHICNNRESIICVLNYKWMIELMYLNKIMSFFSFFNFFLVKAPKLCYINKSFCVVFHIYINK